MTTASGTRSGGVSSRTKGRVLVVAEPDRAATFAEALESCGHTVFVVQETTASTAVADTVPDLILAEANALPALREARVPVVLMAGAGTPSSPPEIACGAFSGPVSSDTLDTLVSLALDLREVTLRCAELERITGGLTNGSAMVGRSPVMRRLADALRRAAESDVTLLIEGQRGTGKSLAARMVHCKSPRGRRGLVAAECGSLDGDAMTRLLEESGKTTLLLEDADRLAQAAQAALVRHLKESPRPGSDRERPRIIATTAAHLPELVAKGAFREDLYYRLNVFPLRMPALRERTEDVRPLAESFLQEGGGPGQGFTAAALMLLESMPWPGNVAQLESAVRRAQVQAGGGPIDRTHLLGPTTGFPAAAPASEIRAEEKEPDDVSEDMIRPFDQEEQRLLARALRATRGNVRRAAQLLGIGRATLYRKIQQYRLRLH
jgi:DNA-binding NtrC family response regulator